MTEDGEMFLAFAVRLRVERNGYEQYFTLCG